MKKARILISMHYLEIGGAESALIGMLNALDPKRVDVDLFLHAQRGELMRYVPSWVRVLPELRSYASIELPVKDALRKGCPGVVFGRWLAHRKFMRYMRRTHPDDWSALFGYIGHYVNPWLPSLRRFGHYDMAISFLAPHDYVLHKADATRRVCWIHTDYSHVDADPRIELPVWSAYDNIVSISPAVTEAFCTRFPSLRDKVVEIGNIICPGIVRAGASTARPADMPEIPGTVSLLTIGRYCHAKNLDSIPALCRRLTERGIEARWYIIGYGGTGNYIRKAIEKEGMEQHVRLLGKRSNPYPYIAACDWYVQPSRYEGKSMAVREAQILGRPVIVTDYPTASSQVDNGVDGVIVPMQSDACAEAMARAIAAPDLHEKLHANMAVRDYTDAAEAEKIYRLIRP